MATDDDIKRLILCVNEPQRSVGDEVIYFSCSVEGEAIKEDRYDFNIALPLSDSRDGVLPQLSPGAYTSWSLSRPTEFTRHTPLEPMTNKDDFPIFKYKEDFAPIAAAISEYTLTKTECAGLNKLLLPSIRPRTTQHFGSLLKKILEDVGYIVTTEISKYYYPSPTSMGLVAPVFGMGLRKKVEPVKIEDAYETTFTYLSHEKPQSKVQIQLGVFDHLPEQRLNEIQRSFKDNLGPYGLKTLYLVIEECGHNKRNPWFILDTNKCLDLMGYKRTKKSVHQTKNRTKLLSELEGLTRINFNVERRTRKYGVKNTDKVIKFKAPLLSITGNFEEWEVKKDRPIEEGKLIKDSVQIFLHPRIYADIGDWYTFIPNAFLTIDTRSKPHAVNLYPYIANQWRIGWHQYRGTIRQPIRQILDGTGLKLPKRANQQRDFIESIKGSIKWLKDQPQFWIKSVRFETKNKALLDQMITITMADNHPLKTSMTKKIAE